MLKEFYRNSAQGRSQLPDATSFLTISKLLVQALGCFQCWCSWYRHPLRWTSANRFTISFGWALGWWHWSDSRRRRRWYHHHSHRQCRLVASKAGRKIDTNKTCISGLLSSPLPSSDRAIVLAIDSLSKDEAPSYVLAFTIGRMCCGNPKLDEPQWCWPRVGTSHGHKFEVQDDGWAGRRFLFTREIAYLLSSTVCFFSRISEWDWYLSIMSEIMKGSTESLIEWRDYMAVSRHPSEAPLDVRVVVHLLSLLGSLRFTMKIRGYISAEEAMAPRHGLVIQTNRRPQSEHSMLPFLIGGQDNSVAVRWDL